MGQDAWLLPVVAGLCLLQLSPAFVKRPQMQSNCLIASGCGINDPSTAAPLQSAVKLQELPTYMLGFFAFETVAAAAAVCLYVSCSCHSLAAL